MLHGHGAQSRQTASRALPIENSAPWVRGSSARSTTMFRRVWFSSWRRWRGCRVGGQRAHDRRVRSGWVRRPQVNLRSREIWIDSGRDPFIRESKGGVVVGAINAEVCVGEVGSEEEAAPRLVVSRLLVVRTAQAAAVHADHASKLQAVDFAEHNLECSCLIVVAVNSFVVQSGSEGGGRLSGQLLAGGGESGLGGATVVWVGCRSTNPFWCRAVTSSSLARRPTRRGPRVSRWSLRARLVDADRERDAVLVQKRFE
jgi:hypothetical protein